jgi:phosphoribosylaminoimidazole (AIR) synthetase
VLGLPLLDCLKTFNWGAGYYMFVSKQDVDAVIKLGKKAGYQLADVGFVEDGNRQVVFEPGDIVLPPPGL